MKEKTAYKLNLPQTAFPMKANSVVREVEIQKGWEEAQVYEASLKRREKADKYVLHDGPPYLSSSKIHIGTALNKVLKDIVTKYKSLRGYYSPYVPGYDSHGLPIENAVLKDVKGGRSALTPVELRQRCRAFALSNLKGQEANFKRLGVWGDWQHPYITLDQKFEAKQLRVFGKMASRGYLYKGLKPVYWCANCETALAEAEVEYADHKSHSIYVKFAVDEASQSKLPAEVKGKKVAFVIWTTTPWSLPGNVAVALHPSFNYEFLEIEGESHVYVIAETLKEAFLKDVGLLEKPAKILATRVGKELELLETKHPFLNRLSRVILGDHVTAEAGTGCVHTAPAHGPEDYVVCKQYNIDIVSPIDGRGIFNKEGGPFEGQRYDKAIPAILEHLAELNVLVHQGPLSHSYPHCWRCKKPLLYRATEQWFASVDGFRKRALESIDEVQWLPASGRNRIFSMVENRSDWCISRQRAWGVPIPVFYCKGCEEPLMTEESINKVADVFDKEGSDSWWDKDADHFVKGMKCKCGKSEWTKETDIMDVWFDSGVTHATVLDERPELRGTPCELYLEGSDQHRGWFQSALLTSVATTDRAPYKTVLTHGFVVDENGRKMSKSVGNVVEPDEVIKQYGADVLRLWVASVNYTDDVPIGKNMLAQLAGVYRDLRNNARFLLGNLYDFDPAKDAVPFDKLTSLDKYVLQRLNRLVAEVTRDFDRFEFFKYYQLLQNFCSVFLSRFYFDIVKDRLYTPAPDDFSRRAVQTVLSEVLYALVRMLAPVTPHLADDIWSYMGEPLRKHFGGHTSVLLTDYPVPVKEFENEEAAKYWSEMSEVRLAVNKAIEQARAAKTIGAPLEASVVLVFEDAAKAAKVREMKEDLAPFFITSEARVLDTPLAASGEEALASITEDGLTVTVYKASGQKCARCWKYTTDVGNASYPDLCGFCSDVVVRDSSENL